MAQPPESVTREFLRDSFIVSFWGYILWRAFTKYRGNRFVEVGAMALLVFLLGMVVLKIPHLPGGALAIWIFLLLGLCLAALFALFIRAIRGVRSEN